MSAEPPARPTRLLAVAHRSDIGGTEVCFGRVLSALSSDPSFELCAAYPKRGALAGEWDRIGTSIDYQAGMLPDRFDINCYRDWLRRRGTEASDFEAEVARWAPDVIVSFTSVLTAPLEVASRLGVPSVAYVREFLHPPVARRWLWRYLSKHADRVIAISSAIAERLEPYAPGRVRLVHDGVPLPDEMHRAAWPPADPLIGFYGGYDDRKGGEVFVRAARTVLDAAPSATFRYHGAAIPSQAGFRDRMRGLVGALGLGQAFEFDESGDFGPTFGDNSVVVMPSVREGLGLVALDAMSHGVPVVASRTGGLTDVVIDGVTGALADVGDVVGFASAIARIVGGESKVRAMGEAARSRVEREFTVPGAVDGLVRVVREVLGGSRS